MYLKRKIDDSLMKWRENPNRLPLIVKGSRQIGKTESIRHFAIAVSSFLCWITNPKKICARIKILAFIKGRFTKISWGRLW